MQQDNAADEMWVPVPGWCHLYEVSDQGRVRSLDRIVTRRDGLLSHSRGRVLRPYIRNGYDAVQLKDAGRVDRAYVHQLVAESFHGARPAESVVRHLNGDARNNLAVNLAWGTPQENTGDSVRHRTHQAVRKVRCKRGHLLAHPNLIVRALPHRQCRSCQRAHAMAWDYRTKHGITVDRQAESDRRYLLLMAGRPM